MCRVPSPATGYRSPGCSCHRRDRTVREFLAALVETLGRGHPAMNHGDSPLGNSRSQARQFRGGGDADNPVEPVVLPRRPHGEHSMPHAELPDVQTQSSNYTARNGVGIIENNHLGPASDQPAPKSPTSCAGLPVAGQFQQRQRFLLMPQAASGLPCRTTRETSTPLPMRVATSAASSRSPPPHDLPVLT